MYTYIINGVINFTSFFVGYVTDTPGPIGKVLLHGDIHVHMSHVHRLLLTCNITTRVYIKHICYGNNIP